MEINHMSLFSYVESFLINNAYILKDSQNEFSFDSENKDKILINVQNDKMTKFLLINFNQFSELKQDFNKFLEKKINYIVFIKDYFEVFIYRLSFCDELDKLL